MGDKIDITAIVIVSPIVLRIKNGIIQVHTQTRNIDYPPYDSLYHNTEEACNERIERWENIIDATIRGCREELGSPDLIPDKIIGANGKIFHTRPEDKILGFEPYYVTQQLCGPQPWISFCSIVFVQSNFEANLDKDGEVTKHTWWEPKNLLKKLLEDPKHFMGLNHPALIKVCEDIINKKIN